MSTAMSLGPSKAEMGQFRFRNWNRTQPLFTLDGIGTGIESTTNFSVLSGQTSCIASNLKIAIVDHSPIQYKSGWLLTTADIHA